MKKAPILSELSFLWLANSIAVFLDDRFLSIAVAILFLAGVTVGETRDRDRTTVVKEREPESKTVIHRRGPAELGSLPSRAVGL
jgi:hypothetical protein